MTRRDEIFRSRRFISFALTVLAFAAFSYFSTWNEIGAADNIQKQALEQPKHVNLQKYYSKTLDIANDDLDRLPSNTTASDDVDSFETEEDHIETNEVSIEDQKIEQKDEGILCSSFKEASVSSPRTQLPQNLTLGLFTADSSSPYISKDIWAELVDNKRTFFLRQYEPGFPNMTELQQWLSSQAHPVNLLMNNHMDISFPSKKEQENEEDRTLLKQVLDEPNLNAFFIENLEYYPETKYPELPIHPKMRPLPRGPKWQWKSTKLFGESKAPQKLLLSSISSSAEETEKLFRQNRSATVWVKSSYETNDESVIRYFRDQNTALRRPTHSGRICEYLKNAMDTKICSCGFPMNQTSYFPELLKHRFVVSPSGISLDTHFTWEALLAGCIPIVPKSPIDSLWEDLPVWSVDRWEDVTDDAVRQKADIMSTSKYNFEKLFSSWWKKEIYRGLCDDNSSTDLTALSRFTSNDGDHENGTLNATKEENSWKKEIKKGEHTFISSAKGPDNSTDYVHDPSFMLKNPKELTINHDDPYACSRPGQGSEKIKGLYYLEKIREHINEMKDNGSRVKHEQIKIMCSVYSYKGGVKNTDTIWETWGKRCDGFFIASSESNLTTGHTWIPTMLDQSRAHHYSTIWQKVRNMMAYLYDNFLDSFDYFHFSGDDTFLIIENLREYLSSSYVKNYEEIRGNLFYAGFPVWFAALPANERYNGGGSGYTLSKKALKAFVEGPLQVELTEYVAADEDHLVGILFQKHLNTSASSVDTRDDTGAHRYHQLGVDRYGIVYDKQKGAYKHMTKKSLLGLEEFDMRPLVFNEDYVSSSSIAFHKMSSDEMKRYEMIIYQTGIENCGKNMTEYFENVRVNKPNFGMEDERICP